jgi:hypothetical protein
MSGVWKKVTDKFDCPEKFVDIILKEHNAVQALRGCRLY